MKKIFTGLVIVSIVLIGCATTAPIDVSINDFTGVWQQVNGSSVITFNKKNFEIVDMERGIAGYGTFKLTDRSKTSLDGDKIDFYVTNILNLNCNDTSTASIRPKAYMMEAWNNYKVPLSERKGRLDTWIMYHGGHFGMFTLNGNSLFLDKMPLDGQHYDEDGTINDRYAPQTIQIRIATQGNFGEYGAFTGPFVRIR